MCWLQTTSLFSGQAVRIWVRATDIMGNSLVDSTVLRTDPTPPIVSFDNGTGLTRNINGGPYNYSSKWVFTCKAGLTLRSIKVSVLDQPEINLRKPYARVGQFIATKANSFWHFTFALEHFKENNFRKIFCNERNLK